MAAILGKAKQRVVAVQADNPHEVLGGNTRAELSEIDQHMRMAKCRQLMAEGVTILYPETCVIDSDVEVGADTVIEPFVQLRGTTRVGSDTRIGSYSVIINCEIGDQVLVQTGCVLEHSTIRARASLGPYSHLRPGCEICEDAHVGNFVELKKSRLGKGSKANHLTYLGDTEIGEKVNVGAGTITCNYDGVNKHKTIIEDGVFVGSDSILIAPSPHRKRRIRGRRHHRHRRCPAGFPGPGPGPPDRERRLGQSKKERKPKRKKPSSRMPQGHLAISIWPKPFCAISLVQRNPSASFAFFGAEVSG